MPLISMLKLVIPVVMLLSLPACYHMRITPEPIKPRVIVVGQTQFEALARIRKVLDKQLHIRILNEERGGSVLISAPHHFFTDTGFGQPPGGRKYYLRLRVMVERSDDGRTVITTAPDSFEIRTSYAYSEDGQMHTLKKVYPYEEYPGMFDIDRMTREVQMVATAIERAMQE